MKDKKSISRRDFVKSSALASGAVLGTGVIASCDQNADCKQEDKELRRFLSDAYSPKDGVSGLLFSQVGYEPNFPVRAIIRLPKKDLLSAEAKARLVSKKGTGNYESACTYWGEQWKSHWWIAEFTGLTEEGEWDIDVEDGGKVVFSDEGLEVSKKTLWNQTIEWSSVDMLDRRKHFTKVGAGWQDAGALWVESPAQSAMIIALEDMLETRPDEFDQTFKERIYEHITIGCDYLVMTEAKATELGHPRGAMSHDLLGHEEFILPNDAVKAVVALYKASRLLPDSFAEKKKVYKEIGDLTFSWLLNDAKPMGKAGLNFRQRGLDPNTQIPEDEWITRDLVFFCWSALEKWKLGDENAKALCADFANQIIARQISKDNNEAGFYGHFKEFDSLDHSESSWVHAIEHKMYGVDAGGLFPNYLMPFVRMLEEWPDHADAGKWKETLKNFTYGFLIPGCESNPFLIVPNGIFGDEGPVWFAGPFHGSNSIYGYTAALALELANIFKEDKLKDIAYGNLQWIAGLNGGLTKQALGECVIFSADVPEGAALPMSMICQVGKRWGGTWFATRGVICNGFSSGKQFRMELDPTKENDGPFDLTDEDWIPHSAGWVTAMLRLYS